MISQVRKNCKRNIKVPLNDKFKLFASSKKMAQDFSSIWREGLAGYWRLLTLSDRYRKLIDLHVGDSLWLSCTSWHFSAPPPQSNVYVSHSHKAAKRTLHSLSLCISLLWELKRSSHPLVAVSPTWSVACVECRLVSQSSGTFLVVTAVYRSCLRHCGILQLPWKR